MITVIVRKPYILTTEQKKYILSHPDNVLIFDKIKEAHFEKDKKTLIGWGKCYAGLSFSASAQCDPEDIERFDVSLGTKVIQSKITIMCMKSLINILKAEYLLDLQTLSVPQDTDKILQTKFYYDRALQTFKKQLKEAYKQLDKIRRGVF